ncbi:MAG TPA: potassium/proton antiporter [Gemmatimonas sp.]|nr:potassium/proton antiporter [Gemmatimonas sp.]
MTDSHLLPAILLAGFGVLLGVSVLFSRVSSRFGMPLTLVFLGVGMLAGSQGIGGIAFDDYSQAFALGSVALAFILFDGGLNSHWAAVRSILAPGALLATGGVVATAALMAVGGHLFGLSWGEAWLIGAIVSSTDAAAVFSVLRASGVNLKRRVGTTLELESGLNDPVAFILTGVVIQMVGSDVPLDALSTGGAVLLQLLVGLVGGVCIGRGAGWLLQRFTVRPAGLVPAFTIAVACLGFGVPALLHGSGFLAVYVAGIALGAGAMPYRASVQRVHDTLAWLSQIGMFLVLGLLSFPMRVLEVVPIGVGLALLLAFVARPLPVAACLLPFGYRPREVAFIGWVGLRGAVPIVLATLPVIARVTGAERAFDVVFVIVVANALLQGTTVPWLARRLRLESTDAPAPPALLEIEGPIAFDTEIRSFHVEEDLPVCGQRIADIPFPSTSSAMLIIRERELLSPRGDTVLQPGDHVYLLVKHGDTGLLQLLFGRPEGD